MKQVLDLEILVWPCLMQAPMVDNGALDRTRASPPSHTLPVDP